MAHPASKRLVLIRHAKAADGAADADRALTGRGRRDAAAVGQWLDRQGIRPDRVVVSPALRAQQTWSAARPAGSPDATIDDRIYANDPELLGEIVRETPDMVVTLVLVGHNPSFERFAHDLDDGAGDAAARRDLASGYPTCGVAIFGTGGSWDALGAATLLGFAAPRADT